MFAIYCKWVLGLGLSTEQGLDRFKNEGTDHFGPIV
jgi:hypothetical protein